MPKNGRPRKTLTVLAGLAVVSAGVAGGVTCRDERCRDQAETARTLDGLGLVVQHISSTNGVAVSAVIEHPGYSEDSPPFVYSWNYQSGQTIDGWTPSLVASSSA